MWYPYDIYIKCLVIFYKLKLCIFMMHKLVHIFTLIWLILIPWIAATENVFKRIQNGLKDEEVSSDHWVDEMGTG